LCVHDLTSTVFIYQELWALFDWATSSRILGELKQFTRNFARPIEQARNKYASEGDLQRGERNNKELQALIKPYFIQRMKEDFLKDKLPPKIELVLWTHLSIEQRSIYTGFVEKESAVVKSIMAGEKTSPLEAVTWLKKLCGHPLLLAENRDGEDLDSALNTRDAADIVKESAKLGVLLDLIKKFSSGGHRTLIFSQ
jgi:SNF2 family DNA or RNA helicase